MTPAEALEYGLVDRILEPRAPLPAEVASAA
jgi:ATP-dependent protease ClpP protease subunit